MNPRTESSLVSLPGLEETAHPSGAIALEETVCIEVDRHDIAVLLPRKPMAGTDMLAVLGRRVHSSQNWCACALPATRTTSSS
jgi:hypothetical protein